MATPLPLYLRRHPGQASQMMLLHDYLPSGNGYKVRLLLAQLGLPFQVRLYNILRGETRTPEFLALNPNGRVPVLTLPDGRHLWESNAILYYLAQSSPLWPQDRFLQSQVLQWMNFEQYSHEPYIATVRFWTFSGTLADHEGELEARRQGGRAALAVMERHLEGRTFFVNECYSIADIALYAYTHVAEEGGYALSDYPAVVRWLGRVAEQSKHILITDPCTGLAGLSDGG